MNFCYKAVLTVNATSWMLVVYGIKSQVEFYDLSVLEIGITLLFIPIILSLIAIKLAEWLEDDSLSGCHECSLADNEFLPVYLGYFFVSLSVPDNITMYLHGFLKRSTLIHYIYCWGIITIMSLQGIGQGFLSLFGGMLFEIGRMCRLIILND